MNQPPSAQPPTANFANPTSTTPPRFNFGNLPTANPVIFSSNQPMGNQPPVRQPVESFTFTPSAQRQEATNNRAHVSSLNYNSQQTFTTHDSPRASFNNAMAVTKKLSDPPTPTSEQSSAHHEEQEEVDTPAAFANRALAAKMANTKLRDPSILVVDRSDPNSPLYSLSSFEDLNLKPDLLKG